MINEEDYIKTRLKRIKGKHYYVDEEFGYCFAKKTLELTYIIKEGKPIHVKGLCKDL